METERPLPGQKQVEKEADHDRRKPHEGIDRADRQVPGREPLQAEQRSRRTTDVRLDYVGFEVPDLFVVGYGMNYAEKYRNLPYSAVLRNP